MASSSFPTRRSPRSATPPICMCSRPTCARPSRRSSPMAGRDAPTPSSTHRNPTADAWSCRMEQGSASRSMKRCWRVAASTSMLWCEDRQLQASLLCFFVEPLSGDLVGLAKLEPDWPAFRTEQQAPQALAKSRQTLLHVVRHLDVQRHDPGAFFPGSLEDLAVLDPAHPVRSDRHVFGLLARPAAFEMCDEALLSLEKFHHPFHRTPVES